MLENDDWSSGDKTLLAHIGNSSDEQRLAVEAALKNNLNNILVETLNDLKNGIEYLKSNELGRASFLVPNLNGTNRKSLAEKIYDFSINRKLKKIPGEKGFITFAKDAVQTDEKWKLFFDKILYRTVIVDTLESALSLSEKYKEFNFAALSGDYLDKEGIIESGSAPKLDDSLFGRKKLLENLKDEYPQREQQLSKLKEKIESVEEKINGIDLKVLSERGRLLVNDLANVEKQIAQFEFEKKKAVDEIEKARTEIQDLATQSNKIDTERAKLEIILSKEKSEKEKADAEKLSLENDFKSFEENYNSVVTGLNKINVDLTAFVGEKKNIENSIQHAKDSIDNIQNSISKREIDISTSGEETASLRKLIDEDKNQQNELEAQKEALLKEENQLDEEYKVIRSQINELETNQKNFRTERDIVSDEIHHAEMTLNELGIKTNNLLEAIKENYSLTLELKSFDDLKEFDFKQRTGEVHALKQQVRNLGPINLLAYSEFEEEKQRFDFLVKQRNDLLESEKDVVKTIEEINTTAQSLFTETFEKIRGHFIEIFRGLFNPGDEADLRLEENVDPLEAKIEIVAKPKGKRPTSIELLSGGEKTLTAIALLFAIYLVKPSPFCILDEIDAPLDDANIDRFTKIISDFSNETQFIVVTHNKRTMEAASTLYGVTMQDEGISKLVSVRFNEDLDFVS